MIKINYPSDPVELVAFESEYYSCLNMTSVEITTFDSHLSNISFLGLPLTFKRLVKLKFDQLIDLKDDIVLYQNSVRLLTVIRDGKSIQINPFMELFNYYANQSKIASFFMRQSSLNMRTCHYCGIDYINAFTDLDDYLDGKDFLNNANIHDLQIIKGISFVKAQKIIAKRTTIPFDSVAKSGFSINIRNQINALDFENGHNHFTLDHVLPQSKYKFYSLCLYNFVPSCYSCNSKFKNKIEFNIDINLSKISPTSENYSFTNDFNFKLFYSKNIVDIKSVSDFVLQKIILRNEDHIQDYFAMFKISGRYTFHKDQILTLIEKKIKYPQSKIKELSKATGLSQKEIKYMIFGKELFDPSLSNQPFVKLKRDIATNIGIDGVI